MSSNQAYNEGYRAFEDGDDRWDNPYADGTVAYKRWNRGYEDACEDSAGYDSYEDDSYDSYC